MRLEELETFYGDIKEDDETLISLFIDSRELVTERKKYFDNAVKNFDENKYDDFLISKLYYEFAREEYEKLLFEVKKRDLDID